MTTYKLIFLYCFALMVLGIAASLFQSSALARIAIGCYIIGWATFLWHAYRSKEQ